MCHVSHSPPPPPSHTHHPRTPSPSPTLIPPSLPRPGTSLRQQLPWAQRCQHQGPLGRRRDNETGQGALVATSTHAAPPPAAHVHASAVEPERSQRLEAAIARGGFQGEGADGGGLGDRANVGGLRSNGPTASAHTVSAFVCVRKCDGAGARSVVSCAWWWWWRWWWGCGCDGGGCCGGGGVGGEGEDGGVCVCVCVCE